MRHRQAGRKLQRTKEQRRALLRNLATSFFEHERIVTTEAKAKDLRRVAEKLITRARKDNVHSRRLAASYLTNRSSLDRLFKEIAPRCEDRNGGYTRIVKLGPRPGDAAMMCAIELVDRVEVEE